MNSEQIISSLKGSAFLLFGIVAYILKSITALTMILIILMILDYVTGLLAAKSSENNEEKISSKKGIEGIKKKVGYLSLFLISVLLDYTLMQVTGIKALTINGIGYGMFSLAVTLFLMSNEFISIVENLGRIGVPIPNFLVNAFKELKDKSEKIVEDNYNSGGDYSEK